MSLDRGNMPNIDAAGFKIAIAASRFNKGLVDALLKDAVKAMVARGVNEADIKVARVPGAAELPFACNLLAKSGGFDAVAALGVVVAGDTPHHEIIAHSTAIALQLAARKTGVPMINGIIVANNRAQAEARTIGEIARGAEFAEAAIEMAFVAKNLGRL